MQKIFGIADQVAKTLSPRSCHKMFAIANIVTINVVRHNGSVKTIIVTSL
jgi:hypothetical protein